MSASIQHGVDTTRKLEWLEEGVYAASKPKTLHFKEGECLKILKLRDL